MPSFTKKAIVATFIDLLAKKPLEKLTVRDIVDACDINRNTFYYYFQDIYAVLEELCHTATASVAKVKAPDEALAALFAAMAEFVAAHKKAAKNLVTSLGRDGMERYLGGEIAALLENRLDGFRTGEAQLAVRFLSHGFIGLLADFCYAPSEEKVAEFSAQIALCARSVLGGVFKNSGKN